jgi:hypothetical protein
MLLIGDPDGESKAKKSKAANKFMGLSFEKQEGADQVYT